MAIKVSKKQELLYNILVKKQRRAIKRYKKQYDEAREGSNSPSLPAMVIPNYAKTFRQERFQTMPDYQKQKLFLRNIAKYGESYFLRQVKEGYLEVLRNENFIGEEPENNNGTYSQDQMFFADEKEEKAMHLYNKMKLMNAERWGLMYMKGYVSYLKFIYLELSEGGRDYDFIQEQNDNIDLFNSLHRGQMPSRHTNRKHVHSKTLKSLGGR